ncbi:hypothetical protein O6H91_02G001200 [Diphasiastrum complanatum]|uniref:Uncharacterized protein n=2 Tax=Diphasiastrum complanatum TaxID=34168 RepID=A0ACC2EC94_DIPCM|nr:hypothetical protein O6H91_02G001200 [Diphasiastrum complanatum]KAJ7564088.1 hypothetical protein O6H91_02G001200 [Diphasiastrum complanatum]
MRRKLYVEVCDGADLMPKDGHGSASPYCIIDYDGQRRKTEMRSRDLQPIWNSKYDFVANPETMDYEVLEINVYSEKKTVFHRPGFLGRVRIPGHSIVKKGEEAIIYYPLRRRTLFSNVKGELGLKVWYADEPDEPAAVPDPAPATDAAVPAPAPDPAPAVDAAAPPAEEAKPETPPDQSQEAPPADQPSSAAPDDPAAAAAPQDTTPPAEAAPSADGAPSPDASPDAAPPDPPTDQPAAATEASEEKQVEARKLEAETPPPEINVREAKEARMERLFHSQPSIVHPTEYILKETKPAIARSVTEKAATYELVETMQYLFVRVVKAKHLAAKDADGSCEPYVRIAMGSQTARTRPEQRSLNPEWNQVFAFGKETIGGPVLEISVWDEANSSRDGFLGSVSFDLHEIPKRVPPDSPLAPQWYRLEETRDQGRVKGDIMVAVWMGTQADEAFTEAWQSDSGGYANTRSKVYISPKMWYLRVNVVEAQEVQATDRMRMPHLIARVQLGSFQMQKTKASSKRSTSPLWNEDLLFVAAEPFEHDLILTMEDRVAPEKEEELGFVRIPLSVVERRVDIRQVASRWFNLEKKGHAKGVFHGRVHLRLCFEGGYHVMDESIHNLSCVRPTAKQLWRPSIGLLELGIIRAKDLLPMKTKDGRGITDAYCVAKYGSKWVRTRTIVDSFNPRWNEPYTWEVYDPCTVLTIAVIDNWHLNSHNFEAAMQSKDVRIGKVRIRLSTLESNRVYTNRYPLLMLHQSGVKKMGEIELAVRFSTTSLLDTMQLYAQPLLPKVHHLHPLGVHQLEMLRSAAVKIQSVRMARSEPPLRQEVVQYVLEPESHGWSLRKSKVNYYRILNLLSGPFAIVSWFDGIIKWKNSLTTLLVHLLFFILVRFPELILPTFFLYISIVGAWQYRFRSRSPPSIDAKLSLADQVDPDELDEEYDPIPTTKDADTVRVRYDRLRVVASRVQKVLGDLATQGERVVALFSWRDPRATAIAIAVCMLIALILYVTPLRVVVFLFGLYVMRHPRFRQPTPPISMSFFRRLPSLADLVL